MRSPFRTAFDFFNRELFGGELPPVIIRDGEKGRACFTPRGLSWTISMNPECFAGRSDLEILSTLVHEMCHCERSGQNTFGKRLRRPLSCAKSGCQPSLSTKKLGVSFLAVVLVDQNILVVPDRIGIGQYRYVRHREPQHRINLVNGADLPHQAVF